MSGTCIKRSSQLSHPLVQWGLITAVAALTGLALARWAYLALLSLPPSGEPAPRHNRASPAAPAAIAAHPGLVVKRNIFCSACDQGPGKPGGRWLGTVARLDGAVLVATLVAAHDPAWTLGVLQNGQPPRLRLVHRGSRIGAVEVTGVLTDRIQFRRGNARGELHLVPGEAPPRTTRAFLGASGIQRLGPGRYSVSRKLIRKWTVDFAPLLAAGDARPRLRQGRFDGITVTRVRARGILARLGLQRGDVITAVNHQPLTSPDAIVNLLAKLPGAHHLTVGLERQGRLLTLDYDIVE